MEIGWSNVVGVLKVVFAIALAILGIVLLIPSIFSDALAAIEAFGIFIAVIGLLGSGATEILAPSENPFFRLRR